MKYLATIVSKYETSILLIRSVIVTFKKTARKVMNRLLYKYRHIH